MRGIKFRAWDKTTEEMLQVKALILAENTLLGCGGKPHIFDEHNDLHPLNEVALMRYTGLKDKNGKEIYEGDIVEAKDPYKYNSKEIFYTCEVVFTEGAAFMLKHTYENWGTVGIRYFGLRDMELEVIGNIYENPELL